jgi:hypothetical protein
VIFELNGRVSRGNPHPGPSFLRIVGLLTACATRLPCAWGAVWQQGELVRDVPHESSFPPHIMKQRRRMKMPTVHGSRERQQARLSVDER